MASIFHYWFFSLLFLPASSLAQIYRISIGDSFPAEKSTASWVSSPSGEFAFGFYRLPDEELFLLAIWFDKIPEKTVVWCANRANPVQRHSRVELTNDGRLVLYNHQRSEIWTTEAAGVAASAAMLDTGKFVLTGADHSQYVWTSFQDPTDTILPTQELKMNGKLQSSRSSADYSIGRFQLRLLGDGNLVLNTISPDSTYAYDAYYISNTFSRGLRVVFNQTGHLYIQLRNNEGIEYLTPPDLVPPTQFHRRATLDSDGVFRLYTYPKDNRSSGAWKPEWSATWSLPSDICNVTASYAAKVGSGICGFNSYCELDEQQRGVCKCLPGYSYLDPMNKFNGCKQDFEPQSCTSDGQDAEKQFELKELSNVAWPLFNYDLLRPINEDGCRESCMKDCFCALAVFHGADCLKKKIPLSNGFMNLGFGGKSLVKVRKENYSLYPSDHPEKDQGQKDRARLILIGSLLLGSSVFLNFFLSAISAVAFFFYKRKDLKHQLGSTMLGMNLCSFTYKELEQVTEGFKRTLGRGAFGTVYKGVLALDSRSSVAVKKLDRVEKEAEEEFKTEVVAISQTHHRNLVHLIGFCNEGPHQLLVYEFMSNGSLASFIFVKPKPDWNRRKQIVLGIARGLTYLHEECSTQIIHCDIKPQNILLDDSYMARISDFGLAKLLKADQTRTITSIRGTKGYVAPEWFRKTAITAKVDVYSFGVVLLEIICGRKSIELVPANGEDAVLLDWAWDCYAERKLDLLVENGQEEMRDVRRLEKFVMVAFWCIQDDPSLRPTMRRVTQMLEGAIEVSVPPCPCSISSLD